MQCVICGGATAPRLIETEWVHRGRAFKLHDVPADVCTQCGEPYFELVTVDCMRLEAAVQWSVSREPAS